MIILKLLCINYFISMAFSWTIGNYAICVPLVVRTNDINIQSEAILIDLCYSDRKIGWKQFEMENNIYIFYDEEVSDYVLFDELSNMYWLCINKKTNRNHFTVNIKCLLKLSLLHLFNGVLTHLMLFFLWLCFSNATNDFYYQCELRLFFCFLQNWYSIGSRKR